MQLFGLCGKAENGMRLGDEGHVAEAIVYLEEARSSMAASDHILRPNRIRVHGLLGQARWRNGEVVLARKAAEKAIQLIDEEFAPSGFESFEGYACPPYVLLQMWQAHKAGEIDIGDSSDLKKLARRACKGLRGYARIFAYARPRSWLWQGLYEWLDGKPDKAQQAWDKSLAYAGELDMPYEQGLTHYEIGRHLLEDDPRRQEHLSQAIDIFTSLDARWDLDQAQKALKRLEII